MYTINRKPGQRIVIDKDVVITVIKSTHHAVKIGIESRRDHQIERAEEPHWRYIPKK